MAINIKFDLINNPEPPTILLANRNGNKLGQLDVNVDSINLIDRLSDASEFSFTLNKFINGKLTNLWQDVINFKLVYCKEWDTWFQIKVELDEKTETIKTVFCTQLGQAELSQLTLYDVEINTEKDIERDDYKVTVLYDREDKEASLLNRLLKDKAPHYSIAHVDLSIANIQRTFSFNDKSIYDAMQEIAEEIGCLFVFNSNSDENGKIQRTISVYDLQNSCDDCGYRGEFSNVCPKCGSENITSGYGEDTLIFVTSDELASEGIQFTTDVDSVKNCFKLEAGDDLMTATIRSCNPNGSDYIWYLSDDVKKDMSDELVEKLDSYDEMYKQYYNDYESNLDANLLNKYNSLIDKYSVYNNDLQRIETPIKGYSSLMNAYYNVVDLSLFLKSSLMPDVKMSDTSASEQVGLLTSSAMSPVAVADINVVSLATVNSSVLSMAKTIIKPTYKVQIDTSELIENDDGSKTWSGNFVVTNYSDEEDNSTGSVITIDINDDVESFVKQKIEKALNKENTDDLSITGLFENKYDEFCNELKKYALNPLISFRDACQSCIDILIEQGICNGDSWSDDDEGSESNLYEKLYVPYYDKLLAIESEIKVREEEIAVVDGVYDIDGILISDGLRTNIEKCKDVIQSALDFEKYLGNELWLDFCSYRREDKYSNENYISDGLNNAELFKMAMEFFEAAEKEIYKSAELQHSISTSLKNLLSIPKFKELCEYFEVGNWIRVRVDDEIYKLRLIEYEIDYGNFDSIPVKFSDVLKIRDGITDIKSILSQASSMATSYSSVQKQANKGKVANDTVEDWSLNGLNSALVRIQNNDSEDITLTKNGLLCRSYDDVTESHLPEQLKLTHNIMAYTNDNWKTVRQAIGKHDYIAYDKDSGAFVDKVGYGMNADFVTAGIVSGSQIIGGDIYSDNYSATNNTGSYINLRDGTFNFGGGSLRFENGKLTINSPDIPTSDKITEINEEYLRTTTVYAEYLRVGSANIQGKLIADQIETEGLIAENISGDTLTGKYISGGHLLIGDKESSYAEIDTDGVLSCSGANITGNIVVNSGDTVQISANNSEGSFINFGEAFSVSSNGLSATSGNFTSLKINGKNVVTEDSMGCKVIVSPEEPSENGIIWIRPSSTNSGDVEYGNSVEYSVKTGGARDTSLVLLNNETQYFTLGCGSSYALSGSKYKYTITFPVILVQDGNWERNVKLSITAKKESNPNLQVKFEYTIDVINAWETKNVEVTVESETNLCADTGAIDIEILPSGVDYVHRLYVQRNSYVTLTSTVINSSENAKLYSCSVYYKP